MCIQFVLTTSVVYSPRFIPLGPSQKVILPTSSTISSFLPSSSAAVTHGVQILLSMCPWATHKWPQPPQKLLSLTYQSANNCSARGGPWEPLPMQHSKLSARTGVLCVTTAARGSNMKATAMLCPEDSFPQPLPHPAACIPPAFCSVPFLSLGVVDVDTDVPLRPSRLFSVFWPFMSVCTFSCFLGGRGDLLPSGNDRP